MLKLLEAGLKRKVKARCEAVAAARYHMTFAELSKETQTLVRSVQENGVIDELMFMMAELPTPPRRSTRRRRAK